MRTVDELIERVRKQGGKATSQRILIWATLYQDRTHPTADDLYRRLKPALPSLSMTTLYNVLNELVEWGEIRRFDTGDGHIHFDPDTSGHAELVCMRCHRVIDAPDGSTPTRVTPASIAGFTVVSHSEQYFGYCPECGEVMRQAAEQRTGQRTEPRADVSERAVAHAKEHAR